MPGTTAPNTLAIGNAIVSFCQAVTYPNTSTIVYSAVQLGEIKDITDQVAASGTACLEIYANKDNSQHFTFGGKLRDEQTWFLLSLVNLDNALAAEQLIYQVRDALIVPFQVHATLGNAGSVYHSQIQPNSGKFIKIFRNGQWLRAHLIEIQTWQEWFVPTPPGVIS
jgi:hypothetical protein